MRICVAQTRPLKGDIAANIAQHKKLIHLAVEEKGNVLVFPELSITGYEPHLAKELAMSPGDPRLSAFQHMADQHEIIIGLGIPMIKEGGINITMVIFHPHAPRQTYSKKYLHADEEPFFVSGENDSTRIKGTGIELAICYEISVPEHAATAAKNGGTVYLASVAKSAKGVEMAHKTLAEIATKYGMTALMANSVGPSDDFVGAGGSAIWDSKGKLVRQLDSDCEGLLIVDAETLEVEAKEFY
ncbi:MAG: carbon-nitrogen hydrolase family protein [Imperialibacter sp.]|uniref:carbon-nitrogen hydrolase family protein n=1 Tax=Imperialibacter sp. TaxID=2038411 RepID=UPI0030DC32C2|tara:strand:- start:5493 stop:6221 length:729 start_codon:yes stop_codon:yes gene_type:complete